MICEQNHQDRQESTGKEELTVKKLFWPEKGFCLGLYQGFLVGGRGIVSDDDRNAYAHEADGDFSIRHHFSEGNILFLYSFHQRENVFNTFAKFFLRKKVFGEKPLQIR